MIDTNYTLMESLSLEELHDSICGLTLLVTQKQIMQTSLPVPALNQATTHLGSQVLLEATTTASPDLLVLI